MGQTARHLSAGAAILLAGALAMGCSSPRDDPLLSAEELFTPTPEVADTPAAPQAQTREAQDSSSGAADSPPSAQAATPEAEESSNEPTDIFGFDYNGTVTLAQWDDLTLHMENFIVGYLIVHGMVYEVKLEELADGDYAAALEDGRVDVALWAPRGEADARGQRLLDSGAALDAGSLYGEDSDVRIVVRSSLRESAPPVFDLLSQIEGDQATFASFAARITGGRVGISANVAGLIFLKQHEEDWTSWISPETAENVRAAIEAGKTSLSYKCLQVRGEQVKYCK